MFRRKGKFETDAAPSRPRTNDEMINSSSDDEEDQDENDDINNEKQRTNDAPEFEKSNTFTQPQTDGNTYVQTNNIHIAHSSNFQIGNQYHLHGTSFMSRKDQAKEEPATETPPPPSSIKNLFTIRKEADEKLFLSIKFDIGPNWRRVAVKLGLKEATIDQLHEKYKQNGISEVFYRLMLKWKEVKPRTLTTVGILCEALWNSGEVTAVNTLMNQHLR